jgi:hypothetical protein
MITRGVALASIAALGCTHAAVHAPPADPESAAFGYFVAKGLSEAQAAGVVGNLIQESQLDPVAVEHDEGPGRGLAQWSLGGRWDTSKRDNMTWYAAQHGASPWSFDAQLDFIWFELQSGGYGYAELVAAHDVVDATVTFQDRFEICARCEQANRVAYARRVLAAHGHPPAAHAP